MKHDHFQKGVPSFSTLKSYLPSALAAVLLTGSKISLNLEYGTNNQARARLLDVKFFLLHPAKLNETHTATTTVTTTTNTTATTTNNNSRTPYPNASALKT